jgi:hypothetical protein
MLVNLNDWEAKTNQLLTFAIHHCQRGDCLCAWYLWHSTGDQVFLRLWWKFRVDSTENYYADWSLIHRHRRARLDQLRQVFEPRFTWEKSWLRHCLTCVDVTLS